MQVARRRGAIPWDPGDHPMYLLGRAARVFARKTDDELRALGFGNGHVPVLRHLADGGARTQSELATLARIEQPTMAQMLARMERDGLVKRARHPTDRRATLFSLTPKALAKADAARQVMVREAEVCLAGFSSREFGQLVDLLQRILLNLGDDFIE